MSDKPTTTPASPSDLSAAPASQEQAPASPASSGIESGGCKSAALGCGVFVSMVIVILIVTGIYLAFHWRSASASFITSQLTSQIQRTPLPADQQQQIAGRIQDVGERFAAGTLSVDQARHVGQEVFSDPIFTAGILYFAGDKLLKRSALSKNEQAADRRALQRFTHGVFAGSISTDAVDAVAAPIRDRDDPGILHVKQDVSDQELKRFVALAKKSADQAQVPVQAYKIDVAGRFNNMAGQALREARGR